LVDKFGGKGMYSNARGKSYDLFTRGGPDVCKEILKFLFDESVGGLQSDIYAQSSVNSRKNIWIENIDDETEKQKKERIKKIVLKDQEITKRAYKEVTEEAKKEQARDKERRRSCQDLCVNSKISIHL
jgi:hypothetical protein